MTYCNNCGGMVGDIGYHHCYSLSRQGYYPPTYIPPQINYAQKCGVCGSTAIDHTENQCQINKIGKNIPIPNEGEK